MLRGINQQQIFEETEDYIKFLEILKDCKAICEFKLFAYCLMGNHIHLLIQEGTESLEQVFKRLCGRFVYWYNIKYRRVGHLFQDRFKSEPVDRDDYFFTVLRYIHQNPTKAGLCKRVEDYAYSSYMEYFNESSFVDRDDVLNLMTVDEFIGLHQQAVDTNCMDIAEKAILRVTDEQAKELIRSWGADRVLFGTDYPMRSAASELEELFKLGLDESEYQCILNMNAKKILNLE